MPIRKTTAWMWAEIRWLYNIFSVSQKISRGLYFYNYNLNIEKGPGKKLLSST